MHRQTLCFLVLGTSLAVLLQRLAQRRADAEQRPAARVGGGEVVDFAAWKELRKGSQLALSAK